MLSLHCKDRKFSPGFDFIPKVLQMINIVYPNLMVWLRLHQMDLGKILSESRYEVFLSQPLFLHSTNLLSFSLELARIYS